jgi:hypothetical protein
VVEPGGGRPFPPGRTSAFALADHLAAKADPALIARDERHFAAVAESLERSVADLSERLDAVRTGIEAAVDRYVAMTRATQQLAILTTS